MKRRPANTERVVSDSKCLTDPVRCPRDSLNTCEARENVCLRNDVPVGRSEVLLHSVVSQKKQNHYFNNMVRGGCVYILVNNRHTVFYVGVTSDLYARVTEHREKVHPRSFTAKYEVSKLVYYETFHSIEEAIDREKQIKTYSRIKKVELIIRFNPEWNDLYDAVKYW